MKFVVIVFLCFVALSKQQQQPAEEYIKKLAQFKDECIKESNVDPNLVVRMWQNGDFANDNNLKCFVKCTAVKTGSMNAAGDVQMDAYKSSFPPMIDPAVVNQIMDKCAALKGTDACDTAFVVAKCSCGIMRGH